VLIRERIRVPQTATRIYRTLGGLWFPDFDAIIDRKFNAFAVLRGPHHAGLVIPAENIITTAGGVFLAQKSAGESSTNSFTTWEQGTAGTPGSSATRSSFTAIASSQLAQDSGYPKTNDGDTDNTGAGTSVRTSRASYSAASFNNSAITHAWITNPSPGSSEPLYTGFAWASSINKTSSDTLKVFHNATITGV
jgi:hypothetical protein